MFLDENPVKNITVGEGYKYLGLTLLTAKQNLNSWLGNLLKSVLKPQHRVFARRTVVIQRLARRLVSKLLELVEMGWPVG